VTGAGFQVDTTIDGRWHAPGQKREGKVPAADLVVATKVVDAPVTRSGWRVWRRGKS
jgi:hypothetical protein